MLEHIDGQPEMWRAIAHHPLNSLFSSQCWTEAVVRTYGFKVSASMKGVQNDGKADGAILYCHLSDLKGERIVCGPFSDYCDPLISDVDTWRELVAPLISLGLPITLRCLSNQLPAKDERFVKVSEAAWHGIDIARPELEIWGGFLGAARQNIRKAQRSGVKIRASRELHDLHVFYEMHCHIRKSKYRLLPQPFVFFENLHGSFAENNSLTVLLAEVGGSPVAATVFLECGGTLYYKFNASLESRLCPNDLLVWEGIRIGQSRGLKLLDFGASDLDQPGLIRFKRKFATVERRIFRLQFEPEGYPDRRVSAVNKTLSSLTHWLTDPSVPDPITQAAGADLYAVFC
ncbi:MAG: GNAT family N-acetyltransferase [Hyphomicrobiales bacterium]|nr:GNAT family N-acetyltransferase [Hyphomicrobiales bacterium]MBV9520116.1 GNAT family N-acetyltransferase [Hyphomicrobiales bacterium]